MTDMSAVFFSSSDNFSPRSRAAFDKNDRIQYTSARARGRRQGHGGRGTGARAQRRIGIEPNTLH